MKFKKRNFLITGVMIPVVFISLLFSMDNGNKASKEVQNLEAFTRLYGYIRFFHPSDEASRVDWDKFAIQGTEKVKSAKNSQELKTILEELFLPVAPTIQIYYNGEKPKKFDSKPPKNVENPHLVAWQHYGVDLKTESFLYKSFRLGRFEIPDRVQNGISLYFQEEVKKSPGKKFKLTARAKTDIIGEKSGGYIHVSTYGSSGDPIFSDLMRDRPIRQNEWKKYEITGEFSKDSDYMELGAELVGVGKMWVDDFHLYLSDQEGNWEEASLKNPGFDEVETGNLPAQWHYSRESLYEYAVVKDNGNNVLQIKSGEGYIPGMLFYQYPKVGEVINKEIGRGLSCQVPLALWSDESETPGKDRRYPIEPLMTELNKIDIDSANAGSEPIRLGNIVISWNVFQHFYPYFDVIDTDWDRVLPETLGEVLMNRTANDFYDTIRKMVAKLQDGHGYVRYKPEPTPGGLPIRVEWIENQVVITVSETSLLKKGDIIQSIDGISGEQALSKAEEYISGSPQLKRYRALNRFGSGPQGSIAQLTLLRNDETVNVEIERGEEKRGFFFNQMSEFDLPTIKKLDEDIYYVNLMTTEYKEYEKIIDQLANARGVIFDNRWDGDKNFPKQMINTSFHISSHLTDEPIKSARWNIPRVIYPDRQDLSFAKSGWTVPPMIPRFKSKIVFIVQPFVVSSGETSMGIIEHYKLAEIVGQTTAGCNGNVNFISLPGGFRVMWTGMKVLKHDGSQHHLIGIQPTVPVNRTIKAVREGRDQYLEKAIEIIRKGKK